MNGVGVINDGNIPAGCSLSFQPYVISRDQDLQVIGEVTIYLQKFSKARIIIEY
jgi:hypothetical protein